MSGRAREDLAGGRSDEWPEAGFGGMPDERLEAGTGWQPDERPEGGACPGGRTEAWPVEPPAKPPNLMSPIALAYVGDAVFELLVRQHLAAGPNHKPDELHRGAVRYVSAKAQRALLEKIRPHLTEEETDIVRRGRNAKSGSPPKGADMSDYRHATALECLFGWLYYAGRFGRMAELLRMADGGGPRADGTDRDGVEPRTDGNGTGPRAGGADGNGDVPRADGIGGELRKDRNGGAPRMDGDADAKRKEDDR